MLIDIIRAMTREFVTREHETMLANPSEYANEVAKAISDNDHAITIQTAKNVLTKTYRSDTERGFLTTLQLLYNWSKENGDHNWLNTQFDEIYNLGIDNVRYYVLQYTKNPQQHIKQIVSRIQRNCSFYVQISYYGLKWPTFSIGAYLIIGLLLHAEELNKNSRSHAE